MEKKGGGEIKAEILLPEYVTAPIKAGETVGSIRYTLNGETLTELPITAAEDVARISFGEQLLRLLQAVLY